MDLRTALRIVRRNSLLILLCVVTVTVAGVCDCPQLSRSSTQRPPSCCFVILGMAQSRSAPRAPLRKQRIRPRTRPQICNLVSLRYGAVRTANALGSGLTPEGVTSKIAVSPEGQSSNVTITAKDSQSHFCRPTRDHIRTAIHRVPARCGARTARDCAAGGSTAARSRSPATASGLPELRYGTAPTSFRCLLPFRPATPNLCNRRRCPVHRHRPGRPVAQRSVWS